MSVNEPETYLPASEPPAPVKDSGIGSCANGGPVFDKLQELAKAQSAAIAEFEAKRAEREALREERRRAEILHRFDKFAPDEEQIVAMDTMRDVFRDVALEILEQTKPGREQAAALTALEEAKYWTNQSIAKDGVPE